MLQGMKLIRFTIGLLLAANVLALSGCHYSPPPRSASYQQSMDELDRINRMERARQRSHAMRSM